MSWRTKLMTMNRERGNRLALNRKSVDPEIEEQQTTTVDDRQRPLENDHDQEQLSYANYDRRRT